MSKEEVTLYMLDDKLLFRKGKKQITLSISEVFKILERHQEPNEPVVRFLANEEKG